MMIHKFTRRFDLGALGVLLIGLAFYPILGEPAPGTLHVSIIDKASAKVVPAMICITSLADNTWRQPPDGRTPAPYVTNKLGFIPGRLKTIDFVAGDKKPWHSGEPGPAVLTTGDFKEDPKTWYEFRRPMPYWNEPAAYFVTKPFDITLPPGKWRLAVQRGIEYVPFREEFTVGAGQKLERKVQMARWVEMPKQGWYSGDPHTHFWRVDPSQDEFVFNWAQAMDCHMTVTSSYGSLRSGVGSVQAKYGKESRIQRGDYWIESGAEDPREDIIGQGHVVQLNIRHMVRDLGKYHLYDYVFDEVHKQGGMVGYTHVAWAPAQAPRKNPELAPEMVVWDASINIIRGKVDFLDIMEAAHLGTEHFYDFLNMGMKLIAMAESDFPPASVGEERTFAYTGPGKFNPDTWYLAVKQGHTFVTNGPMLLLTVDKAMPGDEVKVHKSANVHVHAETWAPAVIGAPKLLEIVSHGRVIRSAESHGPGQEKLTVDFDLPAEESQWLAARTTSFNGALAHTSPIYVIVDGASFLDRKTLPQLVAKRLKALEFIENTIQNPRYAEAHKYGDQVGQLMTRIADARAKYLALK
jgi:hypothetical protein